MLEQRRARDRLPGVAGQDLEYGELARGQLDRRARARHVRVGGVDDQVADLQAHGARGRRAAQQGAQARQQLAEVERLGQVVVGADVEARGCGRRRGRGP